MASARHGVVLSGGSVTPDHRYGQFGQRRQWFRDGGVMHHRPSFFASRVAMPYRSTMQTVIATPEFLSQAKRPRLSQDEMGSAPVDDPFGEDRIKEPVAHGNCAKQGGEGVKAVGAKPSSIIEV